MGVSSKARVCIAIGAAHKPSNAYDAITATKEESLVLREEAMHCDTWQAWSRVKDPNGKEQSIVFAFGVTADQCNDITTWGFDREVCIGDYAADKRQKRNVNVSCKEENISKPAINKCKNMEEMLSAAYLHKQPKKLVTEKSEKYLLYRYIRYILHSSVTKFSQRSLLRAICFRDDFYAEQTNKGTYFKVSGMISDELLDNHIAGKITIGAYTLNSENKVSWLCYDIDAHVAEGDTEEDIKNKQLESENKKNTLCNYLSNVGVPYVLEASGTPYSYHIWIFIKPIDAKIVKHFGEAMMKDCGVSGIELFPKQTSIRKNGLGNLVKLPLAVNRKNGRRSKIFIEGEFVESFDEIEVQAIDISKYEMPEVKKSECYKPTKKQLAKGVRLFFTWALQQKLTEEQGHWLRIGIVREYYNNGTKDPEALARLFKLQPDYDFETSYHKVMSIIKDDYGCWKTETIRNKCPDFYNKFIKGSE